MNPASSIQRRCHSTWCCLLQSHLWEWADRRQWPIYVAARVNTYHIGQWSPSQPERRRKSANTAHRCTSVLSMGLWNSYHISMFHLITKHSRPYSQKCVSNDECGKEREKEIKINFSHTFLSSQPKILWINEKWWNIKYRISNNCNNTLWQFSKFNITSMVCHFVATGATTKTTHFEVCLFFIHRTHKQHYFIIIIISDGFYEKYLIIVYLWFFFSSLPCC